jgi:hypothetical protein
VPAHCFPSGYNDRRVQIVELVNQFVAWRRLWNRLSEAFSFGLNALLNGLDAALEPPKKCFT